MDKDDLSNMLGPNVLAAVGQQRAMQEWQQEQRRFRDELDASLEEAQRAKDREKAERLQRELNALELSQAMLEQQRLAAEAQAQLLSRQEKQLKDAIHDRRVQYAILTVACLTLVAALVALMI